MILNQKRSTKKRKREKKKKQRAIVAFAVKEKRVKRVKNQQKKKINKIKNKTKPTNNAIAVAHNKPPGPPPPLDITFLRAEHVGAADAHDASDAELEPHDGEGECW